MFIAAVPRRTTSRRILVLSRAFCQPSGSSYIAAVPRRVTGVQLVAVAESLRSQCLSSLSQPIQQTRPEPWTYREAAKVAHRFRMP